MVNRVNMADVTIAPMPIPVALNVEVGESSMTTAEEMTKPLNLVDTSEQDQLYKPIAGVRWTLEEERILCRNIEAGKTPMEVSKFLNRSRSAITGKIYGLYQEGWRPKANRKRRSIADLYDEDTKDNFEIPDEPRRRKRGKNAIRGRRSDPLPHTASTMTPVTNGTDQQQQAGACVLCSEHGHEELFECLHCNSRYHSNCLDSIGDVNFSADGTWTCITCVPSDVAESHFTEYDKTLQALNDIERQTVIQLVSVRKAKAQLMEDLRQGGLSAQEQVNRLKRELLAARAELQDSRKRVKEMEDGPKEEQSATVGLQENGDLRA